VTKAKKLIVRRKVETVRERADKKLAKSERPSRHSKVSKVAGGSISSVRSFLTKEYHPVKLPDSKVSRVLTKRRVVTPSYFKNSVSEVRKVEWPSRRQALSLSLAVIVFSVVIAIFVQILDYGLGKLFNEVILK